MENECCGDCKYGRLIYNSEKRDELVGCCKHNPLGFKSEKDITNYLNNVGYKTNKNKILRGWIYEKIPFGSKQPDSGIIVNGCLICNLDDFCNMFVKK